MPAASDGDWVIRKKYWRASTVPCGYISRKTQRSSSERNVRCPWLDTWTMLYAMHQEGAVLLEVGANMFSNLSHPKASSFPWLRWTLLTIWSWRLFLFVIVQGAISHLHDFVTFDDGELFCPTNRTKVKRWGFQQTDQLTTFSGHCAMFFFDVCFIFATRWRPISFPVRFIFIVFMEFATTLQFSRTSFHSSRINVQHCTQNAARLVVPIVLQFGPLHRAMQFWTTKFSFFAQCGRCKALAASFHNA